MDVEVIVSTAVVLVVLVLVVVSVTVPVTVMMGPVTLAGGPETVRVYVVVDAAQLLLVVDVAAAEFEDEVVTGVPVELVELGQVQKVVVEKAEPELLGVTVAFVAGVELLLLLVQG